MYAHITTSAIIATATTVLLAAGPARAEVETRLSLGWDSRYITEGRDNLERGGIAHVDANVSIDGWTLGAWLARGDRDGYAEVNGYLGYARSFEAVEVWVSATRLAATEFALLDKLGDADQDNEFAAGVAWTGWTQLVPSASWVYSTAANGGFVNVASERPITFDHLNLTVTPYVDLAFDFGYSSTGHDGLNNLQTGLRVDWNVRPATTVSASLHHSFALRDVRLEGGNDQTWLSIILSHQL